MQQASNTLTNIIALVEIDAHSHRRVAEALWKNSAKFVSDYVRQLILELN